MDTSDPEIVFDDAGACNHCTRAAALLETRLPAFKTGEYQLDRIASVMRKSGRGHDYDCIVGVSGGVDSTYVAYLCKRIGLRPLAVHFDNGWNSELAVRNIESTLRRMDIQLYTHVVDWEHFRDLQLSFLRASVPDAEVPTDHAIWALLYQTAVKFGIRYVLPGTNLATESILPKRWTYGITDWKYIRAIHDRFGRLPLKTYPHLRLSQFGWYVLGRRIKTISILNSVDYDKQAVMQELQREIGWQDYGGKHHESVYTRFFQSYILPRKFGIDKRRAHLSSLIVSAQISRDDALAQLKLPIADAELVRQDLDYVAKKLEMTVADFEAMMAEPVRSYRDYPNDDEFIETLKRSVRYAQSKRLMARQVGM